MTEYQLGAALGITTALLRSGAGSERPCDGPASLMEAAALLRSFVRITDPGTRRGCLAFVRAAALESALGTALGTATEADDA